MTRTIMRSIMTIAALCLALPVVFGQTTADKYLISADAGGISYVEGEVNVSRAGGTGGVLVSGDKLRVGDRVTTGGDSRAEILLNPGSFMRLSDNSAFRFRTTSLDDLRIMLEKGSAIFEVFATNMFRVTIFTPKSRVTIAQTGVYRIDLTDGGVGTLSAIEGKAIIGDKSPFILKEGYKANLDGTQAVAAKFDRKKGDLFSMWSKDRSKEMAKIAKAFNAKTLRNSMLGFSAYNCRYSTGVWAFSPAIGIGFIPCFDGFDSPYGYSYGRSLWGWNPWDHPIYNNDNGFGNSAGRDYKSGSVTNSAAPSAPVSMPAPVSAPTTTTKTGGGVVDH